MSLKIWLAIAGASLLVMVLICGVIAFDRHEKQLDAEFYSRVPFRHGMVVRHRSNGQTGVVTNVERLRGIRVNFAAQGPCPFVERWYEPYELEMN